MTDLQQFKPVSGVEKQPKSHIESPLLGVSPETDHLPLPDCSSSNNVNCILKFRKISINI